MAIVKTQAASTTDPLIAITAVAGAAQSISAEQDLADVDEAVVEIFHAPDGTGTPTKGTEYRVVVTPTATGNDGWVTWAAFVTGLTASAAYAIDAVEPIGETVIAESATTGLAVDQIVFIKRATLGNSEWRKIVALSANTSFTVGDGLTTATAVAEAYYTQCEKFQCSVSGAWRRVRVICNNNYQAGTTIAINWMARMFLNKWR